MMPTKHDALLFLVVLVVLVGMVGCGGGPEHISERHLEGLQADRHAFWEEWTGEQPAPMAVDDTLTPPTVFDAWRIQDDPFRQRAWDATFHVLTAIAAAVDESAARGLESLMMRLDAGNEDIQWEVSFVSHEAGEAEGLVVRIVAPDGAGVWIEAIRAAEGSPDADRWVVRAEPAVREVDGLTVWWERVDGRWEAAIADSAAIRQAARPLGGGLDWQLHIELWAAALWEPMVERAYLEPDFERVEVSGDPLSDGWPASLGRSIEQRQLGDFLIDTVFPPRSHDGGLDGL